MLESELHPNRARSEVQMGKDGWDKEASHNLFPKDHLSGTKRHSIPYPFAYWLI